MGVRALPGAGAFMWRLGQAAGALRAGSRRRKFRERFGRHAREASCCVRMAGSTKGKLRQPELTSRARARSTPSEILRGLRRALPRGGGLLG